MQLTDDQKILIEKIGVFSDKRGLQPALGRITGFLMVVPGAEATFEEIIENLNLSKSAVSYGINMLLSKNTIEFITKPGQRKRYFRINTKNWKCDLQDQIEGILEFERIITEIIAVRGNENPEYTDELKRIKRFLEFLQAEIPTLITKYWTTVEEGEQ